METTTTHSTLVLAITNIIVAIIAAFVSYQVANKGTEQVDIVERSKFQTTILERIDKLEADYDRVRKEKIELEINQAVMSIEIIQLKNQVVASYKDMSSLRNFINQNPIPMWLKLGPDLRMVTINNKYTEVFGKTEDDYIGNTDFDVWPPEIAKQFNIKDLSVIRNNQTHLDIENVPDRDDPKLIRQWIIIKYPVFIEGQRGVAGMAIDLDTFSPLYPAGVIDALKLNPKM